MNNLAENIARFLSKIQIELPEDIVAKLEQLRSAESSDLPKSLYDSMFENLSLAKDFNRPICQDTGIIHFFIKCGSKFPYIGELESILVKSAELATKTTPLRPNAIETFTERNTGNNIAKGVPAIYWDIIPDSTEVEVDVLIVGGGSSLPGCAKVLMPSEGYKGVAQFVLDTVTDKAINSCPPLIVGVGIAYSADSAALLSKKALLRPIGSRNSCEQAAELEVELENALNSVGIGVQGLGGNTSVLAVNIENYARHPASLGVGVSVGCWVHRRGKFIVDKDLGFKS